MQRIGINPHSAALHEDLFQYALLPSKFLSKMCQVILTISPRRDRNIIIAPEYHLIVTEGTKTEPKYFQGLKSDINYKYQNRISIDIEGVGQGANTVTLLERAVKIVSKEPDKSHYAFLFTTAL